MGWLESRYQVAVWGGSSADPEEGTGGLDPPGKSQVGNKQFDPPPSCRTATLDFFFDLAESKVAVFLCSILTSDGIPFCFGKNSFP